MLKTPNYYRQRFLLLLLNFAGGKLSKRELQKLLFLVQREQKLQFYDFVPFRFGGYSFQAQTDIDWLESLGWLETKDWDIKLLDNPESPFSKHVHNSIRQSTCALIERYRGDLLVSYAYEQDPYYAINSEMAQDLLDKKLLSENSYKRISDKRASLESSRKVIYTIGYEGLSIEAYMNILIKNDVKVLCDLRRNAFSHKFGFSKNRLRNCLTELKIEYVHIPQLGVASTRRKDLNSDKDYADLFEDYSTELPRHQPELQKLEDLYNQHHRIALTCFELSPQRCHRSRVSDYLNKTRGIEVCHLSSPKTPLSAV